MEFEEVTFRAFEPALPLEKIDISPENVRKTRQKAGLEELKQSIRKLGLIHPVIVIKTDGRYSLVSGQRRYLAFVDMKRSTIPALVINPVDSTTRGVISFSENIQRKQLPYSDTITVCNELFKRYGGPKTTRIERIAKDLGISTTTVTKYLAYTLVPTEVRKLVDEGKLSAKVAYRITDSFWPNESKILAIALEATKMTSSEWERVLDVARKEPQASVQEIVRRARIPEKQYTIVILVDPDQQLVLERLAKRRQIDVPSLVKTLVQDLIDEEITDAKSE